MPTPSPEARERSQSKLGGRGYYVKDGKEYPNIHLQHPCGGCWCEITKENSAGNGYCNECMTYIGKIDFPWQNWSEDMKKFWNKQHYLDRKYFDMKKRTLIEHFRKLFKL